MFFLIFWLEAIRMPGSICPEYYELLNRCRRGELSVRLEAVSELSQWSGRSRELPGLMVELLNDPEVQVRRETAQRLPWCEPYEQFREYLPFLLDSLSDADQETRSAGLEFLGIWHEHGNGKLSVSVRPHAWMLLNSNDESIRLTGAFALSGIGPFQASEVDTALKIARNTKAPMREFALRQIASGGIGILGARADELQADLVVETDPLIRCSIAYALGRTAAPDSNTRRTAVAELCRLAKSGSVKTDALIALTNRSFQTAETDAILVTAVSELSFKNGLAYVLKEVLERGLAQRVPTKRAVELLRSEESILRLCAISLLECDPERIRETSLAIAAVLRDRQDDYRHVRLRAATALGKIENAPAEVTEELRRTAESDPIEGIRPVAAASLAKLLLK